MSKHTETVQIYINECQFDADCAFDYRAGEPPIISGLWENSHPGEPEEVTPYRLIVHLDRKDAPKDMTYLLAIDGICEDVQVQLQEIIEGDSYHV